MKNEIITSALSTILIFGCTKTQEKKSITNEYSKKINQYKNDANKLLKTIDSTDNSKKVIHESLNLINQGKKILTLYKQKHPECKRVIDKVIKDSTLMTKLDHDSIEIQYHGGQALPQTDHTKCYDIKELIVHPATVIVLTNKKFTDVKTKKTAMKDEIEEVISHMDEI